MNEASLRYLARRTKTTGDMPTEGYHLPHAHSPIHPTVSCAIALNVRSPASPPETIRLQGTSRNICRQLGLGLAIRLSATCMQAATQGKSEF